MPLDIAFKPLEPLLGVERTANICWFTGKFLVFGFAIYATAYYFKYNAHDWTRKGGWRVISSRKAVVPGDAGYPRLSERSSPADYASHGFKESPI
jgi:NADH dehydrogenase (ubiquinone) 1 beta subcomplex subunit 6